MTGIANHRPDEARGLLFQATSHLAAETVRERAASALWSAAESAVEAAGCSGEDPARAIALAREFAADVIRRLIAGLAPGEHVATCITSGRDGVPGLRSSLRISATGEAAHVDDEAARHAFGALLMLGRLAREPVGVVVQSCADAAHDDGHPYTVRGWVVDRGRARPLTRGAIRTLAGGSLGPHPALPAHPRAEVEFVSAFDLYATAVGPG